MELEILKKAVAGDKVAFRKIYQEYFPGVWRFVYSRVQNVELAEDISADSFVSLYGSIRNIKDPKVIKSYLYRIVRNNLYKSYQNKNLIFSEMRADLVEASLAEVGILDENSQVEKEKRNHKISIQVESILNILPKNYSEVLRLRFLSNLKISEVAEILDKTEANIKVIQNRALKKAKDLVVANNKQSKLSLKNT